MRYILLIVACVLYLGAGINNTAVAAEAKGQVVRGTLYLIGEDGKRRAAPDGVYRTRNGKALKVHKGKILGSHPDGVLIGLLLPAVQNLHSPQQTPRMQHQGPTNPGTLRGFNPQPEPPPKSAPQAQ
jgi:hypothetical protein